VLLIAILRYQLDILNTLPCLAPSSRVARDGLCIFTRDEKLRRAEIIRSQ